MKQTAAIGFVVTLLPGAAFAGLEICNQTAVKQAIAIGYQTDGEWVSEGWWTIPAGECKDPVAGDLKTRYYYVHADASGRVHNAERYTFCTQSDVFTIVGDENCAARGFETSTFAQIDTGETATHHTHTIVEAAVKKDSGQKPRQTEKATASGLTRGQHGEPYLDRLMFQTCDVIDGVEACSFVGKGWLFYAFYDDPTPASYLRQFESMAPNTPVTVTGDLIAYGERVAELAITDLQPLWGQDPYAQINSDLQGDWVLNDDPNDTMFIFGSQMHSYYKGDLTDSYLLSIQPECPDSAGAGPVMVQTSMTYGDEYCYLFDTLAGGWMDLIFMGHEALISYRKVN
ncbi:MAG: DUF1036 domain-containing protein [Pseudomonadota bacterium]